MLTIFSNPRPFKDQFEILQKNAIKSWLKFGENCQIVLFEDENKTTKKVALELGLDCVENAVHNEFGTPLFNDVVKKAKNIAKFPFMVYVNADIILLKDFIETFAKIKKEKDNFLVVGRRRDLDVKEAINFENSNWEENLRNYLSENGTLHHQCAIDYLIFPKNLALDLPPFVVGRPYWDGWFLYKCRKLGIPIIDATKEITAIHQNHYRKYTVGLGRFHSPSKVIEFKRNLNLLNGFYHALTIEDADLFLEDSVLKKNKPSPLNYFKRYSILFLNGYISFSFINKILFFPIWALMVLAKKAKSALNLQFL